jgi:sulfate adenylyltransferase subunit 1
MSTKVNQDIVRFTTAGSVDDGKSTLIGRLMYDAKSIYTDQLEAVQLASNKRGNVGLDLSLLTDGLKAEREQGITIDVAYRYFSTAKRKFIIADTPGHVAYTRNMITGASTANLALILVDARKGIIEQTKRHAFIASLLQLKHVILCVNKMDLVDYSESVFDRIVSEFKDFAAKLEVEDVRFIPISALQGDNVVASSSNMNWYQGSTLLHTLETIYIGSDRNLIDCRLPIQTVIRPKTSEFHDFRGYAGKIASGIFKVGDKVLIEPTGAQSEIKEIYSGSQSVSSAFPPMSVCITLTDDIELSRGYTIVRPNNKSKVSQKLDIMICWMDETPLNKLKKYTMMLGTSEYTCQIEHIYYKVDINTLHREEENESLTCNEIARISIVTTVPVCYDSYSNNKTMGALVLIDKATNNTVAAGMIL